MTSKTARAGGRDVIRRDVIKGGMAAAAAVMLPTGIAGADRANIPRDKTMIADRHQQPRRPLGRLRIVESVRDRRQPSERPEPDLRAAGLLQRLRRQDVHVAGRKLPVHARLQAADDQDPPGHQMERRHAVQRRGRRLHVQHPARSRPEGEMGRRRQPGAGRSHRHRPEHRGAEVQDPLAAVLLLRHLQIRHRHLHGAEAHLPGPGLDELQAFRHRQGLAGHHGAVEGRGFLAAAESIRSARHLVGGGAETGADAADSAQYLAALCRANRNRRRR